MSSTEQCRARTIDGERCGHSAGEDGYCHQHGPDDPTAQSVETDGNDADGSDTDGNDTDGDDGDDATDRDAGDESPATASLLEVRDAAREVASDLVEREVDGVVEVRNHDDAWTAVVEVVERHAVPDTQDILGRYEFEFTGDATATDYRRVDRYRRGESDREEF